MDVPVANVVVVPGTENDVVETVKFANGHSLPFLATNGVHGSISTLGKMTLIAKNGTTATIGGGIRSRNLTDALWAAGKQTVTGTCECVGYLALGGGHGWLQGHHGLVSDQFVSMKVVLANGSLITVDEKSDLFWAMKGAGHNFGIVTSVTSKIYDIQQPNYAIETLIFKGVTVDAAHTAPFKKIGPIATQALNGTYLDLAKWTGISLADVPCQKTGNANPRFPIYLKLYNATAQKPVYDLFRQATTNASTPFSNSLFMFEGYSQGGVKAISDDATAFAYRADNLLVAPLLTYTPNGTALDAFASKLGNQMRNILYEGSGETSLNTYVNYAYGDETPVAWYGSESWRQERLHALKEDFDSKGQFSFYAPIA
ncbi:hypothetical protein BJ875DRAFT_513893 [Amylocarpus encephaloides]|uniref:FAD-binding PCMH-type domain-containing protein n=1 Tax=Amylocarpus encephaloides TaxID=45428 RepID=A0A9P7YF23_9HELO|nr:hypothetical protein BJ875DRAFT_513893 [Amylocarpus encephaloides]